jgi:tetratricopeptide (TPR) repeat protein/serine/threonine protein kinase
VRGGLCVPGCVGSYFGVDRIGPYTVRELIAKGGAGAVYRCVDAAGADVALKVLRRLDQATDHQRGRFRREAEAMASLRHPGIVSVLGAGEHRGSPWLALEYVAGTSLQERLSRQGPLPNRAAAELVLQLADAMTHAHQLGVLHRDLKPDNVLLDSRGGPRLTDFGLTRSLDEAQTSLTRTGALLGTPGYLPPEQAAGRRDQIGPHSDVYGLGAILYACLTGEPPLRGDTLAATLVATVDLAPTSPRKHNPGVDPALEQICLRCLEKEPGARYVTAGALSMALEGFLAAAPPQPRPARAIVPLTGLTLAGLALVGWGLSWGLDDPSSVSTVTEPLAPPAEEQAPDAGAAPADAAPAEAIEAERLRAEAERLVVRGKAKLTGGDLRGALADLDQAVLLDPAYARAWLNRGAVRTGLGDYAGARRDLDQSLLLDPTSVRAWTNRGVLELRFGDPAAALSDLDQALRLDPGDALSWATRGTTQLQLGALEEAVQDFDQAIRLAPESDPRAYANRGMAQLRLGNHLGALQDFDQAIDLDPTAAQPWANRGQVKLDLGDPQGALRDFDQALRLRQSSAEAWADRGAARLRLGDSPGALQDFDQALLLDPSLTRAWGNRGTTKVNLGDYEGALRDLDRAIDLDPSQDRAWANRGTVKFELGDPQGAIDDFDETLRLNPADAETWTSRGVIKLELGDAEGARQDLDQALRLDPTDAWAWSSRAAAKHRLGDFQGALPDLEEALRLDPDDADSLIKRGMTRGNLGDLQGTQEDLERALELQPEAAWAPQVREQLEVVRERLR